MSAQAWLEVADRQVSFQRAYILPGMRKAPKERLLNRRARTAGLTVYDRRVLPATTCGGVAVPEPAPARPEDE